MCTWSRTMSTFSARADLEGSIAGADKAFQTVAADAPAGVCVNPQVANASIPVKNKTAVRRRTIIRRAPATQRENILSRRTQQVPRVITVRRTKCKTKGGLRTRSLQAVSLPLRAGLASASQPIRLRQKTQVAMAKNSRKEPFIQPPRIIPPKGVGIISKKRRNASSAMERVVGRRINSQRGNRVFFQRASK